ncbi:hypothetical protein ACFPTX_16085 [Pseudomonas sp. GCM10022188]|uniref:hypothetical protein n=1 Tax=Pseudomonas TaxID=286 RepID=UPI001E343C4D|nr:hypothetical protein [Pseudomonas oryzagri]MCC6076044.1 hypothetical protein [Pseudomonas oryzagri]
MTILTRITSTNPTYLTKTWSLQEGEPYKLSAGQLINGFADRVAAATPEDLASLLSGLAPTQALTFGLPPADHHFVVTADKLEAHLPREGKTGAIARTNDFFTWNPGPGWLMLDYDPPKDGDALSCEQLSSIIFEAAPGLKPAPMVWSTSSSSEIWNGETGEQVTGIRGQRLYILVADARDIPRAGKALFERLWLAGYGGVEVSRSGSLLMRAPVDSNVWQPNRLDFAAPPVCIPPLECRRPAPRFLNNEASPVDLAIALPSLSNEETERLKAIQREACNASDLLAKQQAAREAWVAERMATAHSVPNRLQEELSNCLQQAIDNRRLLGDYPLIHSSGKDVTVGEILDEPDRWHGERFYDPLEPEYGNRDCRIAWANLKSGGSPYLFSHAHGGVRYQLYRPVETLTLVAGGLSGAVTQVLERLRLDGVVFDRSGELVRVADGELISVSPHWLQNHLETIFCFQRYDAREKEMKRADCPERLAQRLIAARGEWGIPHVTAVVTYPFMRPDGSIAENPGFDAATGLLYLEGNPGKPPVQALDRQGLVEALKRIWQPFEGFPFADDMSRGVFLAALLTTVCRAALATAPAFLARAHTPGTGKTLLSECLMLLLGIKSPSAMPMPDNPDEVEKRLFAHLLTGCLGMILDNLTGSIDNSALCAFLTNGNPSGRILGKSETRKVPNRALFVLNGNNVGAGGDTFRRILPISLDANCEAPETRRFDFNPKDVIRSRLDAFRADLLSVLLSFQKAGAPRVGPGGLGSFEEWERLIRQCVCWLIQEGVTPVPMSDPLEALNLNKVEDPQHQQLAAFLDAWWSLFGGRTVQVRELMALRSSGLHGTSPEEANLIEVLDGIASARGDLTDKSLAGYLRRHYGRVVSGLRFSKGDGPKKQPGWCVRQVTPPAGLDEEQDLIG